MLAVVWFVFAGMFFVVAGIHFRQSRERVPGMELFRADETGLDERVDAFARGMVRRPNELVRNLNGFIGDLNESNRRVNLVETFGYGAAGLTAVLSGLIELKVFEGVLKALGG